VLSIADYLRLMVKKNAPDLYFSSNSPVLIKIEGRTREVPQDSFLQPDQIKQFAYELMGDRHIKVFERDMEANLGVSFNELGRFRVNVLKQRGDVAFVIRNVKTEPPTFKGLNLPDNLQDLAVTQRGLILIAGATGSGKSSTLAAMLDFRNSYDHGHILTIEDPIEFLHPYKKCIVNQREIGQDTFSYSAALKNAMREAPDVILIGEIRDAETMRNAIDYSETGHLCLSTIHASNAIETLDRILNFFPHEDHRQIFIDLANNLKAIICQRLLIGENRKRWPALEVLKDSPYIKELIMKGQMSDIREAFERNLEKEVVTFDQSIIGLYKQGVISKETAIKHADSAHNIEVQMRLLNEGLSEESYFDNIKLQDEQQPPLLNYSH